MKKAKRQGGTLMTMLAVELKHYYNKLGQCSC